MVCIRLRGCHFASEEESTCDPLCSGKDRYVGIKRMGVKKRCIDDKRLKYCFHSKVCCGKYVVKVGSRKWILSKWRSRRSEEGATHYEDFIQCFSFYRTQTNNAPSHSNEQSDYNDTRVQATCLIVTFPNLVIRDGQRLTVVIRFVLFNSYWILALESTLLSGRCVDTHLTPSHFRKHSYAELVMFFILLNYPPWNRKYGSIDFRFGSATETSTCFPGEDALIFIFILLGPMYIISSGYMFHGVIYPITHWLSQAEVPVRHPVHALWSGIRLFTNPAHELRSDYIFTSTNQWTVKSNKFRDAGGVTFSGIVDRHKSVS